MAISKLTSSVQRKGQVTIPQEIRDAFNIQPGDEVYFRRSAEGILITTEKLETLARFNETLDELSGLLAEREGDEEKRQSLESLLEEIREERSQLLSEKYGVNMANG